MELRAHKLVCSRFFYTIPFRLLSALNHRNRGIPFDQELFNIEIRLSQLVGDHSTSAGFFDGKRIHYSYLQIGSPSRGTLQRASELSGGKISVDDAGKLNAELDNAKRSIRAYLGWLLTNSSFNADLQNFIGCHGEEYFRHGIPIRPYELPASWKGQTELSPECNPLVGRAQAEFKMLSQKWRLDQLAGPLLPVPLPRQQPPIVDIPLSRELASQAGMKVIAMPDFFPVPPGQELQAMLKSADASPLATDDEHLHEWLQIIRPSNQGRGSVARYERIFELQHYTRVIYARHPNALARKKEHLRVAFAEYFELSEDAIRKDFDFIKKRLGTKWLEEFPGI